MKVKQVSSADSSGLSWLLRSIDVVLPTVIGLLVCLYWLGEIPKHYVDAALLGSIGFVAIGTISGLYYEWRGRSILTSTQRVVTAWVVSWCLLLALGYLLKVGEQYSRIVSVVWLISVPMGLVGYRILLRMLLRRIGWGPRRVAIVGAGDVGQSLAKVMNSHRWMGFKPVCYVDDDPQLRGTEIEGVSVMGNCSQIQDLVGQQGVSEVFVCLPQRDVEKTTRIFDDLINTHVVVKYVPDIFSFSLMSSRFSNVGGIPVLSVYDSPLSGKGARFAKLVMDKSLAALILLLISPIMVGIAIGVKLTSPGPVFYRQIRVGINNKPFEMLKFRSMPVDTDKQGLQWGNAAKKTTTRFGAFLRKSSLDELPQFINVLKGEMSIVGPRPERDVFVEQFRHEIPRYMQKHMVKAV
jgi:putative colanic acid biosynthesis UDP-glucose lipid carrier transferase